MAAGFKFSCPICRFSIETWDEGHPYIEHPAGKRMYFCHPDDVGVVSKIAASFYGRMATQDEERVLMQKHGGNEGDYVCRECRKLSRLDPMKDSLMCRFCESSQLEEIIGLEGKKCLRCEGVFTAEQTAIS